MTTVTDSEKAPAGYLSKFTKMFTKRADSLEQMNEESSADLNMDVNMEQKLLAAPLSYAALTAYQAAGKASTKACDAQELIFKTALLAQLTQKNENDDLQNKIDELTQLNSGLKEALDLQKKETRSMEATARTASAKALLKNLSVPSEPRRSERLQELQQKKDESSKGFLSFFNSKTKSSTKGGKHTKKRKHKVLKRKRTKKNI